MKKAAFRRRARLGDVIEIKHGYAFQGEHFAPGGKYILLTPGNFAEEGGFRFKDPEKYFVGEFPPEYLLKRGDLLVVMTEQVEGLLGSPARIPEDNLVLHNQRLGLVQVLDRASIDASFLYYLFNYGPVRQRIGATASGTKIRHTSPSKICEVEVDLPPVDVQAVIGETLRAYDDLIENNSRRIKILEVMARALYREWFVEFRFPGHEKAKFVDAPLGLVPTSWSIVTFPDLVRISSGGTPRTSVPEYWGGPIPFFGPPDAPKGFYALGAKRSITTLGLENCNSELYPPETAFFTARGTVGKVVLIAREMAANQSCFALTGRNGLSQYYVFLLARHSSEALRQMSHGAVFDTVVMDTFKQIRIAFPPADLVSQFHRAVEPMFGLMRTLTEKNDLLTASRDLLLPKLISGEIDVSALAPAKEAMTA